MLEHLEIADAGFYEAMQGGQNSHGGRFVESPQLSLGLVGPDDPFHAGAR